MPFQGVIPPLITPLTEDKQVDVPSLHNLIDWMIAGGVDGIFALGSSSEAVFLTDQQRQLVLQETVAKVAGRVPVIAGMIDMQTARVLGHLQMATQIGVDAVVATAPFYAITGPAEIDQHFRLIAKASPVPVFAYDIPVCTHTKLSPAHLVQLGAEGVLAGVKDSSGDDIGFRALCLLNEQAGHPLAAFTGHEVVVDGAYLAGADGCVPGLANVDPVGYVSLDKALRAKDMDLAVSIQNRLAELFMITGASDGRVGPAAGIGAFKTALQYLGVIATNTMCDPMETMNAEEATRIGEIVDRAQITRPL